jgi:hypothetical protein
MTSQERREDGSKHVLTFAVLTLVLGFGDMVVMNPRENTDQVMEWQASTR